MVTNAAKPAVIADFGVLPLESKKPRYVGRCPRNESTMEAGDSSEDHSPEYDFDPEKLNLRVRVTLAADRKAVDPVVEQIMEAVREMKCANGKEDSIELALEEALANAVVHGAKEDPSKVIECLVACD